MPKLIGIASVVAVGGLLAVLTRRTLQWQMTDTAVVIFALLVVVSLVFSIDRSQSLLGARLQRQGVVAFMLYGAGYFLARLGTGHLRQRRLVIRGMVLGATLVAIYAIIQGLGLDPLWEPAPNGRVFSTIGQPNALGAYLAMVLPLTVVAATRRGAANWLVWGSSAAIQLVAILMTASRGAVVAVAAGSIVGLAFMFATSARTGVQFLLVSALAVGALVASMVWVAPVGDAAQRLVDRVMTHDLDLAGQSQGHVDLWLVARQATLDHPVVGTGPDTFPEVFPSYAQALLPPRRFERYSNYRVESPHNIYLAFSSGLGIPALAAFLVLVALAWVRCFENAHHHESLLDAGMAAALAAYLVANFFITAESAGSWLFWLLLGVSATGIRRGGDGRPADRLRRLVRQMGQAEHLDGPWPKLRAWLAG